MTLPADPRSVAVSCCAYRVLLRAYPHRFQAEYREDMALVFRDCCREASREHGVRGLVGVWVRAFHDLGKNVPEEHVSQLLEPAPPRPISRSCSGCYSEVQSDWQACMICGTFLIDATKHDTRPNRIYMDKSAIAGSRGVSLEWSMKDHR